jgi:hypothetical protein
MLITFKSKLSPDLLMYQEHAQRLLDLLHKSPTRGVITAAEAGGALAILEKAVADSKLDAEKDTERDAKGYEQEDGETAEQEKAQQVGFSARAYPFLEMLRTANENGKDIIWGV